MANIFIIHGVAGHPQENWFPWLKKELEKLGHQVIIPQFPTPKNQTLKKWLQLFEKYQASLPVRQTGLAYRLPAGSHGKAGLPILIGHSLGAAFILNIIEKHQVKSAFLVAGFVGKAGNNFDNSMKTFAQKTFDWKKIKANCKNFFIFHSANDPYIKIEKAQELSRFLGTKIHIVKGAGHFNTASGYETFPLLLEKVKNNL